jgi:hypothetical protein
MTSPTCNGHRDLIRTPFGTFFIWLERKFYRANKWNMSHVKIISEATGIVETSGRTESARVLLHHFLGHQLV